MPKLKITVLRKTFYPDLAEEYGHPDPSPCPHFTEGQEIIVDSFAKPEELCVWAWNDLFTTFQILRSGGRFDGYSKDGNSLVRCCTDGIRPVIFNLEWIDD